MSRRKTITITLGSVAAGALLATGVSGMAMAANSDSNSPSSSSSSASAPAMPGQDGMRDGRGPGGPGGPGGHGQRGMLGGPGGEALHGEAVVKAADGTISTVRMIHGTVTAVSSDSITVKAEDGYTATFSVSSTTEIHAGLPQRPAAGSTPSAPPTSTIADVKVGDVAGVEGTVSGSTASATEIHSMTAAQWAQLQADRAAHDAQQSTTAKPSATS